MLTEERLAAIEARCQKATPGPWRVGGPSFRCVLVHGANGRHGQGNCRYTFSGWFDNDHEISADRGYTASNEQGDTSSMIAGTYDYDTGGILVREDAEFIAAARSDVPSLIAEVRRLHELIDVLADHEDDCENAHSVGRQCTCRLRELTHP